MKNGKHARIQVESRTGGWAARRESASRAVSVHATRADAIGAARNLARREMGEVVIHRNDGSIHSTYSYGTAAKGDPKKLGQLGKGVGLLAIKGDIVEPVESVREIRQ